MICLSAGVSRGILVFSQHLETLDPCLRDRPTLGRTDRAFP